MSHGSTGRAGRAGNRSGRWLALLLVAGLVLTACSGDDGASSPDASGATTTTTTAATEGTAATPGGGSNETTASAGGEEQVAAGELETRLADAGIDCAGFTDTPPAASVEGPDDEGRCEIGDEVVYLYAFEDPAAQEAFVQDGGLFDCAFVSAFAGGATIPYAAGDGWVIRPQSEEEATEIAEALDGEVDAVVCEALGG